MADIAFTAGKTCSLFIAISCGCMAGRMDLSTKTRCERRWRGPNSTAQYDPNADLADMAADYMFGLATTQGFLDGNKRTALVTSERFLRDNGFRTVITPKVMYLVALAVARGEVTRDDLAEIVRDHMVELPDD